MGSSSHFSCLTMVISKNREVEQIQEQLFRLANRLAELKVDIDEDSQPPPRFPRKAHKRPPDNPFQMGDRVQVLARDKHYQRQGTIVGRTRGGKGSFWELVLDRRSTENQSKCIRKMPHNLLLLADA